MATYKCLNNVTSHKELGNVLSLIRLAMLIVSKNFHTHAYTSIAYQYTLYMSDHFVYQSRKEGSDEYIKVFVVCKLISTVSRSTVVVLK